MKRIRDGSPAFPHSLQKSSDAPLESAPDEQSPLDGKALVAAKVRKLVVTAGDFSKPKTEFNVFSDSEAASSVLTQWPTELVACPFEMGEWVHYPEMSLENDFHVPNPQPSLMANLATFGGKRNGFMAWDLLTVLYAIRPDRGYFNLSKTGTIYLDSADVTHLKEDGEGKHRYLIPRGSPDRVREALSGLASQPPPIP